MSRIRGRDTTPELLLRKALWHQGMRYRIGAKVLGTRPDIVFIQAKLAVFVDGCFWHGCPEHYVRPRSSNHRFWAEKLTVNTERDERQTSKLEMGGWCVLRVWEHDIECNLDAVVQVVNNALTMGKQEKRDHWAVVAVEPMADSMNELYILRELRTGEVRQISRSRNKLKARTDDGDDGSA